MAEGLRPIETCPNGHRYNTWKYGDTCKVCGAKLAEKDKTVEEWQKLLQLAPSQWACGVLLCIKGLNKGRMYAIRPGKNFIGSDPNMDIPINGDTQMAKKNHAVIMYDEKARKTKILGGDSKGMIYMDEAAVYKPKDLENLDRIEMGGSEFMFIEFCNKDFGWDDFEMLEMGV